MIKPVGIIILAMHLAMQIFPSSLNAKIQTHSLETNVEAEFNFNLEKSSKKIKTQISLIETVLDEENKKIPKKLPFTSNKSNFLGSIPFELKDRDLLFFKDHKIKHRPGICDVMELEWSSEIFSLSDTGFIFTSLFNSSRVYDGICHEFYTYVGENGKFGFSEVKEEVDQKLIFSQGKFKFLNKIQLMIPAHVEKISFFMERDSTINGDLRISKIGQKDVNLNFNDNEFSSYLLVDRSQDLMESIIVEFKPSDLKSPSYNKIKLRIDLIEKKEIIDESKSLKKVN